MIAPEEFTKLLLDSGVTFFAGVPDSLLKNFGTYLADEFADARHAITANEGAAVGMAIGHHLRTGEIAAVYMQNSGIGNAVNPLLSLADREVYSVPMLLIIGWRGQPGVTDEPQHVKQGRVMEAMLSAMEVPYATLPVDEREALSVTSAAIKTAVAEQSPVALLVPKDAFARPRSGGQRSQVLDLPSREAALQAVLETITDDAIVVSTTGMLSRELFEYRASKRSATATDFLTVGGMGHASSIALAIALREPARPVWCLDGDGALLMHAGTLAVAAQLAPPTYYHVVFNNGVHDSVGGQPTAINSVNVPAFALAAGYRRALAVRDLAAIAPAIREIQNGEGPALIDIAIRPGARPDLGRPTTTPLENKTEFMVRAGASSRARI